MKLGRYALILLLGALCTAPCMAQSSSKKGAAVFAASELETRCESSFRQYERFKSNDRLNEMGSSGRVSHTEITDDLHHELGAAITLYLAALEDGWSADDPELTTARETIEQMSARMEECGMWTCFRWDDALLDDAAREHFDRIRSRAWEATLLVEIGELDEAIRAFEFADTLTEEYGEQIETDLDRGQVVEDWRSHAAYARTMDEVRRLKSSVQASLYELQATRDQLVSDVGALAAVVEMADPLVRAVSAGSFSGTEEAIIEQVERVRQALDTFEAQAAGEIREIMTTIGNRYGADRDAIAATVTRIMGGQQLDVPHSPQMLYETLTRNLEEVANAREQSVEELMEIAERNAATEAVDPARREQAFALAERCLGLALEIDPDNAGATELRAGLGAGAAAAAEEADALLDQGTWDPHSSGFQGPGNVNDLAASALAWIRADAGWSGDKDPVAVRINGDWVVAERNILDEPTSWGLPIEAAFVDHAARDAGRDLARVFRLTMVSRDAEKSPPWKAVRVGSIRQMRASTIEASGIGGGGGGSGPNVLFRLLLVVALLASGLVLLTPVLTTRVAALAPALAALGPIRAVIGVAALAIGVILLVFNLLSPLSDLLPQAAAIVAGLFLGLEVLLRKRTAALSPEGAGDDLAHKAGRGVDSAIDKAQGFLASHERDVRKISAFQTPLGIACVVLGLLHLVAANAIFL